MHCILTCTGWKEDANKNNERGSDVDDDLVVCGVVEAFIVVRIIGVCDELTL